MVDRYGAITSVRSLPDKFCAFINFKNKKAAAQALVGLQVTWLLTASEMSAFDLWLVVCCMSAYHCVQCRTLGSNLQQVSKVKYVSTRCTNGKSQSRPVLLFLVLKDLFAFLVLVLDSKVRVLSYEFLSWSLRLVMWRSCSKFAFVECEFQLPKFVEFECECHLIKVYFITRNATHWFMSTKWMLQYVVC